MAAFFAAESVAGAAIEAVSVAGAAIVGAAAVVSAAGAGVFFSPHAAIATTAATVMNFRIACSSPCE